MALDVQPITGTSALAAARLCNFHTGHASLLHSHIAWLDSAVKPLATGLPNPWVDLIGFASRLGNHTFNQKLSFERCEAIRKRVLTYGGSVSFPIEWGKGDSESVGPLNDGYWRAVEVYVYGFKPPPKPKPKLFDHKVRLHFRSVAMPQVPEFTALASAQKVYAPHRIEIEFASGFSMKASADQLLQLDASDGTCKWNQASDEQQMLNKLGGRRGAGPKDIVVYFANQIVEKSGKKLGGCAGHEIGKAAVVVASSAVQWALAHEVGHVLLGPNFDPTHTSDKANLMYQGWLGDVTADPPSFTPEQLKAIRASPFCISV
jgi:hypothetical protein